MRVISYLIVIIIFAFVLSLNTIRVFSLEEMSLFLTVIGLIYGLVAAFTINNAWDRFSKIRDGISVETDSLKIVYLLSKNIGDKISFRKIKEAILEYCKDVPEIEWKDYWKSDATHEKFMKIIETVSNINIKNERDSNLFDHILEESRQACESRNQQLILAQTRISKIQWVLNIFLSAILVVGLVFISVPQYSLSIFITTAMIASVIMMLLVIYELDSMKVAEEEVSNEPYRDVVKFISKGKD